MFRMRSPGAQASQLQGRCVGAPDAAAAVEQFAQERHQQTGLIQREALLGMPLGLAGKTAGNRRNPCWDSGSTSLSATPHRPACPSRASGWSSLTTLWGFPCCGRFPCVRAAASTPVQRLGVVVAHLTQPCQPSPKLRSGRPAHRPFRGLRGVHSRCGPHTRAVTYM